MKAACLKVSSLCAAVLLSVSFMLTSCDNQPDTAQSSDAANTTAATTTQATSTTATAETEPTGTGTQPDETQTEPAPTEPSAPASSSGDGAAIAETARSLIGKPYLYGAVGPEAFDNSGFIVYCLQQNGLTVPRKTGDIARAGTPVDKNALQPGDVVFFYNDTPGVPQFAGIYVGDGTFIACNNEEKPVSEQDMTLPYFQEHYVSACRF